MKAASHRLQRIPHASSLLLRHRSRRPGMLLHTNGGSLSTWQAVATTNRIALCSKRLKSSTSSVAEPVPVVPDGPDDSSRSSRSSSLFTNPLSMNAIKERVKSSLLQEASREDSRLWQQNGSTSMTNKPVANGTSTKVNGNQHHSNDQHNNNLHQQKNSTAMNQQQKEQDDEMNTTLLDHHDHDASSLFEQPLSDMLLLDTEEPRYWPNLPPGVQAPCAANDPFLLTKSELDDLSRSIREDLLQVDQPLLNQAASYFFNDDAAGKSGGGKKIRPLMVLLLSRVLSDATASNHGGGSSSSFTAAAASTSISSTSLFAPVHDWQRPDLPQAQYRLAQVIEMIHAATLFHDDVLDKAATRRGRPAVHVEYDNKTAILAGDYLVGRTSVVLARLRNPEVFEAMSTIIEHLVRGEVMQMAVQTQPQPQQTLSTSHVNGSNNMKAAVNGDSRHNSDDPSTQRLLHYLRKNFYKTGSLMAHTCRSAALLGNYDPDLVAASYRYGKHLGMAFQLVDDILDFSGSLQHLGKPPFSDLRAGLATAPVLFAAQEDPQAWQALLDRQFSSEGDVERAVRLLEQSNGGMERTKLLARVHAEKAMDAILEISSISSSTESNHYRDALIHLAYQVVSRTK